MDRPIVYSQEQGRSTDFMFGQRSAMVGLAKLAEALFGASNNIVAGLSVVPNSPAALNVIVNPGQIYAAEPLDATAYGILAADTAHSVVKQGLLMDAATLACPAPGTAGYSINYLIEATYQDSDTTNVVLPYFNSANPSQPLSGQNNTGAAQPTERQGLCIVQVKAGTAATTGTQSTPAPDSGFVGLAIVTVANGQSSITSGNISAYSATRIIPAAGVANLWQPPGTPTGVLNGTNQTYTLPVAPAGSPHIFINGLHMVAGVDYTISGATITHLGTALVSTDTITYGEYRY